MRDQFYNFFVIALCVANQPLNRKITTMVQCLSLCLKSHHENYLMKIIPVFWIIRYLKEGTLAAFLYRTIFFKYFSWDSQFRQVTKSCKSHRPYNIQNRTFMSRLCAVFYSSHIPRVYLVHKTENKCSYPQKRC